MKKKVYYLPVFVITLLVLFFTALSGTPKGVDANKGNNTEEPGFVVMELFTSQGCSSCPPADEISGKYALKNDEHIIPLAFHVDYWNSLGWIDPFSNSMYSQRQSAYAERFKLESIYTPQLIINGQQQLVGSDGIKIAEAIQGFIQEKATVMIKVSALEIKGEKVFVDYILSNRLTNCCINAALVQKNMVTRIRGGENRGVKLKNYNVVRDFKTVQIMNTSGNFIMQLPKGSDASNCQVILFVQENNFGNIIGAVKKNCE